MAQGYHPDHVLIGSKERASADDIGKVNRQTYLGPGVVDKAAKVIFGKTYSALEPEARMFIHSMLLNTPEVYKMLGAALTSTNP